MIRQWAGCCFWKRPVLDPLRRAHYQCCFFSPQQHEHVDCPGRVRASRRTDRGQCRSDTSHGAQTVHGPPLRLERTERSSARPPPCQGHRLAGRQTGRASTASTAGAGGWGGGHRVTGHTSTGSGNQPPWGSCSLCLGFPTCTSRPRD